MTQVAGVPLLLVTVFRGFPEPFPKEPASQDHFSCCCAGERCPGRMQGGDPWYRCLSRCPCSPESSSVSGSLSLDEPG